MNPEGMVGLLDYREDGTTPYMLFFKDGLLAEKCVSVLKQVFYLLLGCNVLTSL